jgi:hypothetical protein
MTGVFYRKEQFSSPVRYTLFTHSDDGLTFSLDRRTLVSIIDERFGSRYEPDTGDLVFYSASQTYRTTAPYQIVGEDAENINIIMQNISGGPMKGWQASLMAGNEAYYTNTLVAKDSFAKLEIGIYTAADEIEWIKYHDCVIAEIDRGWKDGDRKMSISLVPDGLWHTSVMSHPYYMEWQGKQTFQSSMQSLDGFEQMGGNSGQHWPLTQDLWVVGSADGFTRQTHSANITTDLWAEDMLDSILTVEYPKFGSDSSYLINIYGWSRAGVPSQNPNVADSTPTDTPNDDFYGLVKARDPEGAEHTYVTLAEDLESERMHPAQTWFPEGARDGSYPVSFYIQNPGEGWEILELGVRIISGSGNTTYFIERVEMPGIIAEYTTVASIGYVVEDDPDNADFKRVINTQKGIDQIMFSTPSPFSTWNFDLIGRFKITGPNTYAGLVGLATDKDNMVIGHIRPGYVGLSKMRYGIRTLVCEDVDAGIVDGETYDVRFWHRDGVFGIEWKAPETVAWPSRGSMFLYTWTAADGEISYEEPIVAQDSTGLQTDSTGSWVYHVGIWSLIDPPKFRTTGFRSTGVQVPVMPLDIDPSTGSSGFDVFPSSGNFSCDNYVYSYQGKNSFFDYDKIMGPFQLRAILDWHGYNWDRADGHSYKSMVRAAEIYDFAWISDADNHDLFNGAIVASNNGYSWVAKETFFKPWVTTDGAVVWQLERMRVYSWDNYIPEEANQSLRVKIWLTNGLTDIDLVKKETYDVEHSEGSFCYIDHGDSVIVRAFMGASGDQDNNIESLLDKVCKLSGTEAAFPGDLIIDSASGTINL